MRNILKRLKILSNVMDLIYIELSAILFSWVFKNQKLLLYTMNHINLQKLVGNYIFTMSEFKLDNYMLNKTCKNNNCF